MAHYKLSVPPTNDQGSYNIEIHPPENETVAAHALWHYNSAREHDGLPPLKRMPAGTVYTRLYKYVIQQWTGSQYQWENVTEENERTEGLARLREYRENMPQYRARMIRRPR